MAAKHAWVFFLFLVFIELCKAPNQLNPWMCLQAKAMDGEDYHKKVEEKENEAKPAIRASISMKRAINGLLNCIGDPCVDEEGRLIKDACGDFCICSEVLSSENPDYYCKEKQ